ncbi:MAG: replication initiation protein [Dactylosporangium sp.]|nr:replication initiation protein [Dactylosporangium sp.]
MTAPTLPLGLVDPAPAGDLAQTARAEPAPRPGSRAARLALPRSAEALRTLAIEYGVCVHPVPLRRTDLTTGETEVIDLPCGATREDKCPSCAKRAKRLRQQQCREGWHRADEPLPDPHEPTDGQQSLVRLRAHFEFEHARALASAEWGQVAELDAAIGEVERAITESGMRGCLAPTHPQRDEHGQIVDDPDDDNPDGSRRHRSTRRRQDAPDLPRQKVAPRTIGRTYTTPDGRTLRPSIFLTLTLDSYGRVRDDGTPLDPNSYDYRRAARDAVHFPALLDRFWQNLRRCVGWNTQYFGTIEPQRRLAPHAHFAIRGTIPRTILKQVIAATYRQIWWPATTTIAYPDHNQPVWDDQARTYVDPHTRQPLPTWAEALDTIDDDQGDRGEAVHVVRFGRQTDITGVLGGTPEADKLIGYLTKYLTKTVDACHTMTTDRQAAHLDRLWHELRYTPCSPRCPNWLRYGVQPKGARPNQRPGRCKTRVHQKQTLGLGGRRVLVSRQWSGKTLADHKEDTKAWVRAALGLSHDQANDPASDLGGAHESGQPARVAWEMARPDDPDVPPPQHRLLRAISARIQNHAAIEAAKARERQATATELGTVSATTPDDQARREES